MKRRIAALAGGAALAAAALAPTAAHAGSTTATHTTATACDIWLGSVTAAGAHHSVDAYATTPPTVKQTGTPGIYKPGQIRLSARQISEPAPEGNDYYGYVVGGDTLYSSYYNATGGPAQLRKVGSGWAKFTAIESAEYESPDSQPKKIYRRAFYGLRSDGVLFRWRTDDGTFRANGSYPGFASVKSMALIAKTATYDTFLANTRSGGLYTIRIPSASPMKPVVTAIRTKTWQGFEVLSAMACGKNSTLLMGIDKDAKTAYLYAVSHANGAATVIQSRGRVPGTFDDPVYFRWTVIPVYDDANGG
jgi:hypothetical protein